MTLSEKLPSRLLAILASTLLLTAQAAIAATINVTTEADVVGADGKCSLREAISNVNAHAATVSGSGECAAGNGINDTILVPAGTYALSIGSAGEDHNAAGDFDIRANVDIEGAGIGATIIDGNHIDRAFDIPVDGLTVSMEDISIRNGLPSGHRTNVPASVDGGGIFVGADTLGLLRVELSLNQAGAGSLSNALYNYGGDGGALYADHSTLTIIDCVFDGNVSGIGETVASTDGGGGQGGAMYLMGGSATITRSSFTNNHTQDASGPGGDAGFGGAIYVAASDNLAIAASAFDSNQAGPTAGKRNSGGALAMILDTGDVVSITRTSITRNSASFGGGIAAAGGAGFTIVNSTIADNQADTEGGGIFFNSVIAHIDFTTITKNDSTAGSGIVANNNYNALPMTTINLRNSIVSGNTGGGNGCTSMSTVFS